MYSISGFCDQAIDTVERYCFADKTWSMMAGRLNFPRTKFQAVQLTSNLAHEASMTSSVASFRNLGGLCTDRSKQRILVLGGKDKEA